MLCLSSARPSAPCWQVKVMHPEPGLCQLIMPQVLARAVREPWLSWFACCSVGKDIESKLQQELLASSALCWLSCRHRRPTLPANRLAAVARPLCICDSAAAVAALQTWLHAPPLLLPGLHRGSCDSAAALAVPQRPPLCGPCPLQSPCTRSRDGVTNPGVSSCSNLLMRTEDCVCIHQHCNTPALVTAPPIASATPCLISAFDSHAAAVLIALQAWVGRGPCSQHMLEACHQVLG